jgi:hypothetical protein
MSVQPSLVAPLCAADQEKVYRICDVIRGAHSLAIAVSRPPNDMDDITTTDIMLQQWGQRVWT